MAARDQFAIEITPQVLLKAYSCGIFPMAESADDPALYWIEPQQRGVLPLDGIHLSSRLAQTIRNTPLKVRFDTDFAGLEHDEFVSEERGHGRREKRSYTILSAPTGIRNREDWKDLTVIGMCMRTRHVNGTPTPKIEHHYFIGSRKASAKTYANALRNHWGIENRLHWQLDVSFAEDANRVSKRNEAENLALVRKLALMMLKRHPSKQSIACKQLIAALNPEFLENVLLANGSSDKI